MKIGFDSFFHICRAYCLAIKNGRTNADILNHLDGEREELQREVDGTGDGRDGIIGENIDMMLCNIDMIFKEKPDLTEEELLAIVFKKLDKWRTNYSTATMSEVEAYLPQMPCETASQVTDASEIFRLAQLSGGEGVGTAEKRILAYLQERDHKRFNDMEEAIQNALGMLDTPISRRRFGLDTFYGDVVASLKKAIGR